MNIAVIGAGRVGGTLANRWAELGHAVWVGARDPDSEKTRAFARSAHASVHVTTVAEAAVQAKIILLATPWGSAQAAIESAGDLSGKTIMDAINPLKSGGQISLIHNADGEVISAAEKIAHWAPGAQVVKAFNTTGVGNMARPDYGGLATDHFICGDDPEAKALVAGLGEALGMHAVDVGPLFMARSLEHLACLWVYLAYSAGYGTDFMFKLVQRSAR